MGVAFTLGFFLILLLIIGAIGGVAGVVILIVRYIRKKKTQKKYIFSQISGILFLVVGILCASIPAAIGTFAGSQFVNDLSELLEWNAFFYRHEKTAVQIPVEEDSIHAGKVYWKDSFVFNDKEYFEIPGVSVVCGDIYRGEAVANLNDGVAEVTVYEYLFPENCELLCVGENIYCTNEKIGELTTFYNYECKFTYQYQYFTHSNTGYVDMEMNDEMFLGLINYEEEYVADLDEYSSYDVEYYIIQSTGDGRFERTLNVLFDKDGTIIVDADFNPLSRNCDKDTDAVYHYVVTDVETQQFLRKIGEHVKAEKQKYK